MIGGRRGGGRDRENEADMAELGFMLENILQQLLWLEIENKLEYLLRQLERLERKRAVALVALPEGFENPLDSPEGVSEEDEYTVFDDSLFRRPVIHVETPFSACESEEVVVDWDFPPIYDTYPDDEEEVFLQSDCMDVDDEVLIPSACTDPFVGEATGTVVGEDTSIIGNHVTLLQYVYGNQAIRRVSNLKARLRDTGGENYISRIRGRILSNKGREAIAVMLSLSLGSNMCSAYPDADIHIEETFVQWSTPEGIGWIVERLSTPVVEYNILSSVLESSLPIEGDSSRHGGYLIVSNSARKADTIDKRALVPKLIPRVGIGVQQRFPSRISGAKEVFPIIGRDLFIETAVKNYSYSREYVCLWMLNGWDLMAVLVLEISGLLKMKSEDLELSYITSSCCLWHVAVLMISGNKMKRETGATALQSTDLVLDLYARNCILHSIAEQISVASAVYNKKTRLNLHKEGEVMCSNTLNDVVSLYLGYGVETFQTSIKSRVPDLSYKMCHVYKAPDLVKVLQRYLSSACFVVHKKTTLEQQGPDPYGLLSSINLLVPSGTNNKSGQYIDTLDADQRSRKSLQGVQLMDCVFDRGKYKQKIVFSGFTSLRENQSYFKAYTVLTSTPVEVIPKTCNVREGLVTSKDVKLAVLHTTVIVSVRQYIGTRNTKRMVQQSQEERRIWLVAWHGLLASLDQSLVDAEIGNLGQLSFLSKTVNKSGEFIDVAYAKGLQRGDQIVAKTNKHYIMHWSSFLIHCVRISKAMTFVFDRGKADEASNKAANIAGCLLHFGITMVVVR